MHLKLSGIIELYAFFGAWKLWYMLFFSTFLVSSISPSQALPDFAWRNQHAYGSIFSDSFVLKFLNSIFYPAWLPLLSGEFVTVLWGDVAHGGVEKIENWKLGWQEMEKLKTETLFKRWIVNVTVNHRVCQSPSVMRHLL